MQQATEQAKNTKMFPFENGTAPGGGNESVHPCGTCGSREKTTRFLGYKISYHAVVFLPFVATLFTGTWGPVDEKAS